MLTGSQDRTAILWDAAAGQRIQTYQGHLEAVTSVAFSGDGQLVLTGSWDKSVILWDAASGQKRRVFGAGAGNSAAAPGALA